jgi:hypothetical protein
MEVTMRRFAYIILILDPIIEPDKVQECASFPDQCIGIGPFRPRNKVFYGRFRIEDFEHADVKR